MDISIIIVNYNGKRYIDNLFESLANMQVENLQFEIVFVDNNSIDDSLDYLEKNFKEKIKNLNIVKSNKNLGFAGGNNLGVKNAKGEYIVFLNNDTAVEREWLINLHRCIKDTGAGIVNSKLLFFYDFVEIKTWTADKILIDKDTKINKKDYRIDNKFCKNLLYNPSDLTCFGNSFFYIPLIDDIDDYKLSFKIINYSGDGDKIIVGDNIFFIKDHINEENLFEISLSVNTINKNKITMIQNAGSGVNDNYDGYDIGFCEEDNGQYEEIREIGNGCGASMIMKKEDFLKVGGFDEKFFMYYEDTDLSYRIKNILNKRLLYCPNSIVRHIHTGSSVEWSPFFVYHVNKNKLFFILKNFGFKKFLTHYRSFVKRTLQIIVKCETNKDTELAYLKSLISVTFNIFHYLFHKKRG